MANEQLPPDAYGPINKDRPGNIDPFAKFDNYIRYQDMVRYQTISQYEQSSITPQSLSWYQQRGAAQGAYQYGTGDDSTSRYYQRQREMARMGRMGGILSGAATFAPVATITMGGLVTGIGISAVAAIPGIYIARGVDRTIERQRLMQEMAVDLDQRRSSLGFNSSLSYNDSTNLASRMLQNMGPGPGEGRLGGSQPFFNREQGLRIHKIALANNMMNARGFGADSGTMKQYEKNFKDLTKTTEDVVKLLQTTIEGGMSVIKNLQQSGFRTMKDVNAQIRQAKAFGGLTGLGAENMMQVGAAGAQAVQGTPYSAMVGANMYQQGATQAGMMARGSMAGQHLIDRVGGVGAAGAAIGRFHMNIFSSGMGTKLAAYMMNPDGTMNQDRLNRVTSGKVGVDEMIRGAGDRAYAMGAARASFEEKKMMLYNDPTTKGWERDAMTTGLFNMWRKNKPSSVEDQAWVFAGLGTNDIREQQLMKNYLLKPKGYWQMDAASNVEAAVADGKKYGASPYGLKGLVYNVNRGMTNWGANVGNRVMSGLNDVGNLFNTSDFAGTLVDKWGMATGRALGVVSRDRASLFKRGSIGDEYTGLSRALGVDAMGGASGYHLMHTKGPTKSLSRTFKNVADIGDYTGGQLDRMLQMIAIAKSNDTVGELISGSDFRTLTRGISLNKTPTGYLNFQKDSMGFINNFPGQIANNKVNIDLEFRTRQNEYYNELSKSSYSAKEEDRKMYDMRISKLLTGSYNSGNTLLDKKRDAYITTMDNQRMLSKVGDYNDQLYTSQVTAKGLLSAAAISAFRPTVEVTLPASSKNDASTTMRTTMVKQWDKASIEELSTVVPSLRMTDKGTLAGMGDLVRTYQMVKDAIGTGTLTEDTIKGKSTGEVTEWYRKASKFDKAFSDVLPALNDVDRSKATVTAFARVKSILGAADRMEIPMTDDFRKQFTNVMTGVTQNAADVSGFAKNNEETLNRMAGVSQKGYFTKNLTGSEDFSTRFLQTADSMASMAGVERDRKRGIVKALQYAIYAKDNTMLRAIAGSETALRISGEDATTAKGLSIKKESDMKDTLRFFENSLKMDESGSVTTGDRGNTRYANVNPPITNYWNNRWVL